MNQDEVKNYLSDKYQFLDLIGKGGFAEVYLAKDKLLEREIAIKILLSQYASDSQTLERFIREAKIYAKLEHRNLIPIYDIGIIENNAYIIMKYIEGFSLKHILIKKRILPIESIRKIIREMATALQYIHSKGIVHRDIKPANIIIENKSDKVFLADFGIARTETSKTLTQSGSIIGTPFYISPEQIKGKKIDNRTDIYAFGATLYELITGKPIFEGESSIQILYQHVNEEPKPISNIAPETPKDIEYIISKCLKKDPRLRFQNAWEILNVIDKKDVKLTLEKIKPAKSTLGSKFMKSILMVSTILILGFFVFLIFINSNSGIKETQVISPVKTKQVATSKKTLKEDTVIPSKSNSRPDEKTTQNQMTLNMKKTASQEKDSQTTDTKRNVLINTSKLSNKTTAIKTKTFPQIEAVGSVTFSSSLPADIYWNDIKIGNTAQVFSKKFKPGSYIFEFVIPGYQNIQKKVIVQAEEKTSLHQKFSPYGLANINSKPFNAKIYINNKDYGSTPLIKQKIPTGSHNLKIIKSGYKTINKTIIIENRKLTNEFFNLQKEGNNEKK